MDQLESRDDAGAGRTQHAIHILPRDEALAASLVRPSLERVELTITAPQVLVILPDRDAVYALAAAVNAGSATPGSLLAPIVASPRGERRLHSGDARAICATAEDIVALMSKALFKPQDLRSVAVVWADDQTGDATRSALETVLAEVPRDADRMLLVSELNEAVEKVATGFLWRARRMQHALPPAQVGSSIEYAVCVPEARAYLVRLLLERLDPTRAQLVVQSDDGERDARAVLAALGYDASASGECRVVRDRAEGSADLAIIMEVPGDVTVLANARGDARRAVALVPPARVVAVAAALGDGGAPIVAAQALRDAYTARDVLRDEVLGTLRGRPLTAEVLALESLVAERDPLLVAAALWRLLETERGRARKSPSATAAGRAETSAHPVPPRARAEAPRPSDGGGAFSRLFINIGERDGVRRGDLVGAITGEAGIDGSMIGKIELRDSHAIVEVAQGIVDQVIARLTGVSLRGRKVAARIDSGRPPSDRPVRGRPERREGREGGRSTFSGGRPGAAAARGGTRGTRDGGARRSEGTRPGRGAAPRDEARGPRVMREAEEWGNRSESLRNSRRKRDDT